LNFFYRFSKGTQISNLTKIRSVEAELFYADGRTDTHNRFSQFWERT